MRDVRILPTWPWPALAMLCLICGAALGSQNSDHPGPYAGVSAQLRYPPIALDYYRLSNGLKVVLAPDTTTPVVVVAVYYGIGQRLEPPGHEGFAHLFEHLMFEGSTHLKPGELLRLIQSNGGTLNGNTRFDFTDYFEIVPPPALRLMLWAEADRMGGLLIDDSALRRQKDIVKSEIRLSYINQPDGGFPWLDVPKFANKNWQNAHNFRGLPAGLDSASLDDVRRFHAAYYVPNNAVVVVSGNFRPPEVRDWIHAYFGQIPRGPAPQRPDISEPAQAEERRGERIDSLADRPVLAVAFHMPARGTKAFYAMAIIDQVALQGNDSWLARSLIDERALAGAVFGGANLQGNMFNYQGPMLWTVAVQYSQLDRSQVIVDSIQQKLDRLASTPLEAQDFELARRKAKSALYDDLDYLSGFGKVDLLAANALFDDNPNQVNGLETAIDAVTAADVLETARSYLNRSQRTVYIRRPPSVNSPDSARR
jgi:zinc protease